MKEAKLLPTDFEKNPVMNCTVVIPQNYNYHTDEKFNSIQTIRDKLRKNKIDHLNFDPIFESGEGLKYYHDLYQRN